MKKKMKKRTKIQWIFYFKRNVFLEHPRFFFKLKHKKWKYIKLFLWKYKKERSRYKSPLLRKKRLYERKQFFSFFLKEKQFFKQYYNIPSEKQFKKILRKSFKKKKSRFSFYSLIQQRVDHILVRVRYAPTLKKARFLIKNKFIYLNDRLVHSIGQIVKKNDILSVDFKIRKYILKNILKKVKKKRFKIRKSYHKKKKRMVTRKIQIKDKKKLKLPKVFEINYKTLDLLFYKNFSINHFKIANDLSLDIVQRTYRR